MKFLLFFSFFAFSCFAQLNHLQNSTSPYLLQHLHDPVDWHPYSQKIFRFAAKQNQPVYISIGYSSCHWCHVMHEESFSSSKIAALLNKYFICVKVDKEELPHIDTKYQNIYYNYKHHRGGWPLNVFVTPKEEPLYITNYIPAVTHDGIKGFDHLIFEIQRRYEQKQLLHVTTLDTQKQKKLALDMDELQGGFGEGAKFVEYAKLRLLYERTLLDKDETYKDFLQQTLHVMRYSGFYDQVEDGFFRYTVDSSWQVPHFEKMLYTQAQMIQIYTKFYHLYGVKFYKQIIKQTIAFVNKFFNHNDLYYTALDADVNAKEGAYYTFTPQQLHDLNISYVTLENDTLHVTKINDVKSKNKLLELRKQKPFVDKKIITSYNAMMIAALYEASSIEPKYLNQADRSLRKLLQQNYRDKQLYHQSVLPHQPKQKALLEDYAYLIDALISAYEHDFDHKKLALANALAKYVVAMFYAKGIWHLNTEGKKVVADTNDKYYMSAKNMILLDLQKLAALTDNLSYDKIVKRSLHVTKRQSPGLMINRLIQKHGYLIIKAKPEILKKYGLKISNIRYPYLLIKAVQTEGILLCKLGQCLLNVQSIDLIRQNIEYNHLF